ncbi:Diguanylate cyclase with Chase sensor [Hyella patelloides LEGE 07179]|uniref:Diguanylate cyclase with Chase sensor n=1 Tax=Hyella patelloides LEGE 07179 TaxID=945734 RepID=A0A563VUR5_9CYAN|nr:sensor domain-containing diguanylate cyclase [Hyella patelloides]VEP15180.1 Diguanylate cyclase with Chase sensor [Hyella patelloides LEGE 07179]
MFTRLRQFLHINIRSVQLNRFSSFQAAILVFLISLLSTTVVVWRWEQYRITTERSRISNIAYDYANNIQRSVESTLSVTYALSALVHEYQGIIPNFKTVAQDLLPLYPGADALALLPGGVVEEIITLENNDVAINYNQLEDLHQTKEAAIAKYKEQLTLTVSFTSRKNFSDAIGYLPIFLENDQRKPEFWGFTTVKIHFPEVLKDIHLEKLEDRGLAYQLWRIHPETQQKQIIASSSVSIINNPVEQVLNISDANWILSLTPIVGWNQPSRLYFNFLWGLSFSLMLATLVKLFFDSKVHAFELEKIAYFDSLTGLPNRRLLLYHLEQIIAHTQRSNTKAAICYLDLDNFKAINDHFGYKAGDYLLVRIAKRLQKFLRLEDVIARVSGDEFVIVLKDLSHIEEVELILERIMEAVTTPMVFDSKDILVSASIGVTIYPQDNSSINTLLNHADRAMYYSKKNRKGSYTLFCELEQTISQSPSQ